jgi:hypothetical protein
MKLITIIITTIIFTSLTIITNAQSNNDIMVGGNLDLIKTDYSKFFNKAQIGIEGNYFIVRHFSVSAGAEVWTKQKSSFVMGMRWYPQDHFFVRFRGLIGQNDVSIGGGWAKPINDNLRFEAIGDFYIDHTEFAIRAGVSYTIKKPTK